MTETPKAKRTDTRPPVALLIVCVLQLTASIIHEVLADNPVAVGFAYAIQIFSLLVIVRFLVIWSVAAIKKRKTAKSQRLLVALSKRDTVPPKH